MKRPRLILVIVVLAGALAALVYLAFWRQAGRGKDGLRLTGHIEATETNLGFKAPGKTRAIHFEEGQWIKAGQVVAELEADDLRQEVAAAEAGLKAAQANLEKLVSDYRPQEVREAQAAVAQAKADFVDKERDFRRMENLFARKVVTAQVRDRSEAACLMAKEALRRAQEKYDLMKSGSRREDVDQGRADLTQSQAARNGLDGHLNGPIDDIQLRSWGIQLVDGRMPGFAAIVGAAKSNEVAVKIVRELQRRSILTFLCGNVNGRSIIHQLNEEGVELGYDTFTVPFGTDTISAIYALGFATRSALTFGGMKGGQARDILMYNNERVFAFVLALGEVDDLKYAAAAGAINFGFPVIADTVIPEILPTSSLNYNQRTIKIQYLNFEPGSLEMQRRQSSIVKIDPISNHYILRIP